MPQGSVLGPLLFIIDVNSPFKLKLKGKITVFADDTAIIYGGSTESEVMGNYYCDINVLVNCFWKHKLKLNAEKCNFINFGYKIFDKNVQSLKVHTWKCDRKIDCNCPSMERKKKLNIWG